MDDFDDLNRPLSTARREVSTAVGEGKSRRKPLSPEAAASSTPDVYQARQAGGENKRTRAHEKAARRRARPAAPPGQPQTETRKPPPGLSLEAPRDPSPLSTALSALAIGALVGFLAGFFIWKNER